MFAGLHTFAIVIANLFKSRRRLEAENLLLRHQLNLAMRRVPARLRLRGADRSWGLRAWHRGRVLRRSVRLGRLHQRGACERLRRRSLDAGRIRLCAHRGTRERSFVWDLVADAQAQFE
jgi:hypothetical protein